jgi:hypothetical protein
VKRRTHAIGTSAIFATANATSADEAVDFAVASEAIAVAEVTEAAETTAVALHVAIRGLRRGAAPDETTIATSHEIVAKTRAADRGPLHAVGTRPLSDRSRPTSSPATSRHQDAAAPLHTTDANPIPTCRREVVDMIVAGSVRARPGASRRAVIPAPPSALHHPVVLALPLQSDLDTAPERDLHPGADTEVAIGGSMAVTGAPHPLADVARHPRDASQHVGADL